MEGPTLYRELQLLDRPLGSRVRTLIVAGQRLRIEGLDPELEQVLERRWGPFLGPGDGPSTVRLSLLHGRDDGWLKQESRGELYRIEALDGAPRPVVVSYSFALTGDDRTDAWRVAVAADVDEPPGRVLDNVARYLLARRVTEIGGFAMHGAGVVRDGRAHVFVGPSGSGKTTAVELSGGTVSSLGDDFAVVLREGDEWVTTAVPFDNAERVDHAPPAGSFPVAGVWRLFQDDHHHVERPGLTAAAASLMSCAAFPWAMPDLAGPLLTQVSGFVADGRFAHLHFSRDAQFWSLLV